MDDFNSDELDEEIRQSQVEEQKAGEAKLETTVGRSGRRRVPVAAPVQMDDADDYDDEEDESFGDNDGGNDSESDDEEGEEEMDDDIDEDKIDKDEMKALKGNKVVEKKERKKKN